MLHQILPQAGGSNAWVGDPDPVTLIGSGSLYNYSVQVTVMFSDNTAGNQQNILMDDDATIAYTPDNTYALNRAMRDQRMRKHFAEMNTKEPITPITDSNIPAAVITCDSSSKFQQWLFNSIAPGYLSNGQGNNALCLNVDGCVDSNPLIYYQCVTSGGTCCGATCYTGLQFSLSGGNSGQLISALDNHCVIVQPDGTVMLSTACSSTSPNATWTYNTNTHQLQLQGSNLCLTAPPSINTYAQVCGRLTGYSGFVKAPPTGYCFVVSEEGNWYVRAGNNVLTKGMLGGNFNSMNPNVMTLVMKGHTITGYFNDPSRKNSPLFTIASDNTYVSGLAAIGSGYHYAVFDNFSLNPE